MSWAAVEHLSLPESRQKPCLLESLALAFEVDLARGVVRSPWDSFRIPALLALLYRSLLQQGLVLAP